MLPWQIWLLVAGACVLIEIGTPTFFIFWFGVGAACAALTAYLGLHIAVQMVVFISVSLALAASTRKFAKRVLRGSDVRTNVDALIGKVGVVLEDIDDPLDSGQVKVDGEVWTAVTTEGFTFKKGDRVAVLAVDGVKLVIQPLTTWQDKGLNS